MVKNPSVNVGDRGLTPQREHPTGQETAKPVGHTSVAGALEPGSEAHVPQSPCSATKEEAKVMGRPRVL